MSSESKEDREAIYKILAQLKVQSRSKEELDQLMTILGFEDDVSFAKSLFSERVTQIYRDSNTQYESFLSQQSIAEISDKSREFLFALFRKYHEFKIAPKRSNAQDAEKISELSELKLPDTSNIEEVIAFQKKMYTLFKHLMPKGKVLNQNICSPGLIAGGPKFTPFPIFPDRGYPYENDYFPMGSYVPNFTQKCSNFQDLKKRSSGNSFNRSDSFFERPSFFANNFSEFERSANRDYLMTHMPSQEESSPKGFTNFNEDMESLNPSKKIKRDPENINFSPQNMEAMRKELDFINQTRNASSKDDVLDLAESQDAVPPRPTPRQDPLFPGILPNHSNKKSLKYEQPSIK